MPPVYTSFSSRRWPQSRKAPKVLRPSSEVLTNVGASSDARLCEEVKLCAASAAGRLVPNATDSSVRFTRS